MRLNLEQIRSIVSGAVKVEQTDGMYHFFRFTEAEKAVIENANLLATASIQLEFVTDASKLKLSGLAKIASARSYYAIDVLVSGNRVGSVSNMKEEEFCGNYAEKEYPLGSFLEEFILGDGEKTVRIVLPHSVIVTLSAVELEGATYVKPKKREKTLVAYGDSITQGYDALHPTAAYAVRLSDALSATLMNKSLGGAVFDARLPEAAENTTADYVLVAYGTNDWGSPALPENANAFFETLVKKYPDSKIFALTPIWRGDYESPAIPRKFSQIEEIIREACQKHGEKIQVISGWNLVPKESKYFGDTRLHPNDEGFSYYCDNILKELEE